MLKAYLSAQATSLSGFVISKTHIVQRERQLNTKVCGSKSAIFLIYLFRPLAKQRELENCSGTHLDFSMKWMLITARSFPTIQRLHSLKFTLVNKSQSQHSVIAVRCERRHLYARAHKVLFPGQIPRLLVWE